MPNLGELRDAVLLSLNRADAPTAEQSACVDWINEAIREKICVDHSWPSQEAVYDRNTVANQEDYAFPNPSNLQDVVAILIKADTSDYIPLDEVTAVQARYAFLETTDTGQPRVWFRFGSSIFLRPIPDKSTYTMRAIVTELPGTLVNDSNSNAFTEGLSHVVKAWARVYGYEFYKEWDFAQAARAVAELELQRSISADKAQATPARIVAVPSQASGMPNANRRGWRRDDTGPYRMYP